MFPSSRNHVRVSHLTGSPHTRILLPLLLFRHQLLLPRSSIHNLSQLIHLHYPHTVAPKFGSRDHIAMATSCPSTFRTTSSNIWTPILTAPPPLQQHLHVQHHPQLTHQTALHHHHNPLHLPYFHHCHHFQNFHSRISRPTSSLPPSSGSRAARLLQRLQIC